MFHVKHGGMAELWGRQFEKYHFSPTRYRGVGVSRGTWEFVWDDLLGLVVVVLRGWDRVALVVG